YEPDADYLQLTREANGRRINVLDAAHSLLLLKATARIPHGGGKRLEETSPAYQTLLRWIQAGAAYQPKQEPRLERVEVTPGEERFSLEGASRSGKQLVVTAVFSDGHSEDVTPLAVYSSTDDGIAQVEASGRVTPRRPGDAFIIASYLGKFG